MTTFPPEAPPGAQATPPPDAGHGSPYVGPRPFTGEDRDGFFGREAEIDRLVSEVIASPTLVIYAVSGAGKTSLLAAGLRPALREQGFVTLPMVRLAGQTPGAGAHNAFTSMTLRCLAQREPDPVRNPWRTDDARTLADALAAVAPGTDVHGFPRPRALVFDQFEELFTLHGERWQDRRAFFAEVTEALEREPELRVVFALREEYLAQFGEHAGDLPRVRFHLERLRSDAALSAVTGPIQGSGRRFATGVAERLVHDLRLTRVPVRDGELVSVEGEFVEPLHLQVVCRQLWGRLTTEATEITDKDLDAFGNVDEALTAYYDESVAAAASTAKVPEYRLRATLQDLFVTSAGTRATVFAADAATALGVPAVSELERRHLIRTDRRSEGDWLELAHDRLIGPMRLSNEAVLDAHRRSKLRRGLAAVVVLMAVVAGVLVAVFVSTTNQNATLVAQVSHLQVVTSAARKTDRQAQTAARSAVAWVRAFNSGKDPRAAELMSRVIRVQTIRLGQRHGPARLEPSGTYLRQTNCNLGPAPTLGTVTANATIWWVNATASRNGHSGCRHGYLAILTLTVRHGLVVGVQLQIYPSGTRPPETPTVTAGGSGPSTAGGSGGASGGGSGGGGGGSGSLPFTTGSATGTATTRHDHPRRASAGGGQAQAPTPASSTSGATTTATGSSETTTAATQTATETSTGSATTTPASTSATTPPTTTTTFTIVTPTTGAP